MIYTIEMYLSKYGCLNKQYAADALGCQTDTAMQSLANTVTEFAIDCMAAAVLRLQKLQQNDVAVTPELTDDLVKQSQKDVMDVWDGRYGPTYSVRINTSTVENSVRKYIDKMLEY